MDIVNLAFSYFTGDKVVDKVIDSAKEFLTDKVPSSNYYFKDLFMDPFLNSK